MAIKGVITNDREFDEACKADARFASCFGVVEVKLPVKEPEKDKGFSNDFPAVLKEVMGRYDECRAKWISKFGNAKGFDEWFRKQST